MCLTFPIFGLKQKIFPADALSSVCPSKLPNVKGLLNILAKIQPLGSRMAGSSHLIAETTTFSLLPLVYRYLANKQIHCKYIQVVQIFPLKSTSAAACGTIRYLPCVTYYTSIMLGVFSDAANLGTQKLLESR
jgi:hypothetical protein